MVQQQGYKEIALNKFFLPREQLNTKLSSQSGLPFQISGLSIS